MDDKYIWILQNGQLPYAVFDSFDKAVIWIKKNQASGMITGYPLNETVLAWALRNNFFKIKKEKHKTVQFEEKFTSASMLHYHFENGNIET